MELQKNLCADSRKDLPEVRCSKCRRLFFYGQIKQIEIKCPKCKLVQNIKGTDIPGNQVESPPPKNIN